MSWDGRDAFGAVVPPGIYWVALDFDGERVSRRVVLLP